MMPRIERQAPTARAVRQTLAAVREAFRHRRLASRQVRLYELYLEHNLFDEAHRARELMLDHLREARRQWRTALGLGS